MQAVTQLVCRILMAFRLAFTIPQSITDGTRIGYFEVLGGIPAVADTSGELVPDNSVAAEYLDGIISGPNSGLFDLHQ